MKKNLLSLLALALVVATTSQAPILAKDSKKSAKQEQGLASEEAPKAKKEGGFKGFFNKVTGTFQNAGAGLSKAMGFGDLGGLAGLSPFGDQRSKGLSFF